MTFEAILNIQNRLNRDLRDELDYRDYIELFRNSEQLEILRNKKVCLQEGLFEV